MLRSALLEETGNMEKNVSKRVGWYPRPVNWPYSMQEVEHADEEQLLEWYRFLPSATDNEQKTMITRIIEKLYKERRSHEE